MIYDHYILYVMIVDTGEKQKPAIARFAKLKRPFRLSLSVKRIFL